MDLPAHSDDAGGRTGRYTHASCAAHIHRHDEHPSQHSKSMMIERSSLSYFLLGRPRLHLGGGDSSSSSASSLCWVRADDVELSQWFPVASMLAYLFLCFLLCLLLILLISLLNIIIIIIVILIGHGFSIISSTFRSYSSTFSKLLS